MIYNLIRTGYIDVSGPHEIFFIEKRIPRNLKRLRRIIHRVDFQAFPFLFFKGQKLSVIKYQRKEWRKNGTENE